MGEFAVECFLTIMTTNDRVAGAMISRFGRILYISSFNRYCRNMRNDKTCIIEKYEELEVLITTSYAREE